MQQIYYDLSVITYKKTLSKLIKEARNNDESLYKAILFYYGCFYWKDKLYSGKHNPIITKAEYDLAQGIISGNKPSFYNNHIFAFTGMIKCGECGAGITAEKKTKHQKNGNIHHYTYYHCTKRITLKCIQKTIRDTELERQIIEILSKIEIPSTFHQWAIKYLKEEQSKEAVDRDEILKSQQKRLDSCIRKQDSLFEMRINSEIDKEEYLQRKEQLIEVEQRYKQLIDDTHNRAKTWLDNAEKLFSFAETAKKRFESGNLVVKREILACLGSNLTLLDRKLNIKLQEPLFIFTKYSPELKALRNRLEPLQDKTEHEVMEVITSGNEIWGE